MTETVESAAQDQATAQIARETADVVADVTQQLTAAADVGAVFGDPQTVGDRTIIPVAEVMCVVAVGVGSGRGDQGGGTGGGVGGAARARPVAAIVVEPAGVRVQPVVDVTTLGLAALSVGVFGLLWLTRLLRGSKGLEKRGEMPSPRAMARLIKGVR